MRLDESKAIGIIGQWEKRKKNTYSLNRLLVLDWENKGMILLGSAQIE